jgi:hypothetical protein
MPIQITAKRDGFRRCGIAHSEKTTTYQDSHFNDHELSILESEPNLIVVRIGTDTASGDNSTAEQKIAELSALLEQSRSELSQRTSELAEAGLMLERCDEVIELLSDRIASEFDVAENTSPVSTTAEDTKDKTKEPKK